MKKKIAISIITHNRPHYLKEAIDSVLDQSFSEFDLFILDNASSDDTYKLIKSYDDARINYRRSETNDPLFQNTAFENRDYKYLMLTHDDDYMDKEFLKEQLSILDHDEKIDVLACRINLIDSESNKLNKVRPFRYKKRFKKHDFIKFYFINGDIIPCPTCIFRSDFLIQNNLKYRDKVGPARDLYLFFEINLMESIIAINQKPLYYYRIHKNQDSELNRIELELQIIPHLIDLLKKHNQKILLKKYVSASTAIVLHIIIFKALIKQLNYKKFKIYFNKLSSIGLNFNKYSIYWSTVGLLRGLKNLKIS